MGWLQLCIHHSRVKVSVRWYQQQNTPLLSTGIREMIPAMIFLHSWIQASVRWFQQCIHHSCVKVSEMIIVAESSTPEYRYSICKMIPAMVFLHSWVQVSLRWYQQKYPPLISKGICELILAVVSFSSRGICKMIAAVVSSTPESRYFTVSVTQCQQCYSSLLSKGVCEIIPAIL